MPPKSDAPSDYRPSIPTLSVLGDCRPVCFDLITMVEQGRRKKRKEISKHDHCDFQELILIDYHNGSDKEIDIIY
uniref:Uncharacterized protein n=1 Tax=Caenorhabditis japonica TaxID=281687 RepID=A0A8R1IK80_CAEJA